MKQIGVTIVAVDGDKVFVRDAMGNEHTLDNTVRRKGQGKPDPGERWVMVRKGNVWMLDTQIGAPQPLVVTGDRDGMHPVEVQLLEAMREQGLVLDQTVAPVIPEWDDITDPAPWEPEDEQWEDAGDEGIPEEPEEWMPQPDPEPDEPRPPKPKPPPPKPKDPPKDRNDDDKPASEVAADLISVVSFNQFRGIGPKRARKDLRRLWQQADLIGLQECHSGHRRQVLANHPDNWGLYQPPSAPEPPIMWRESVFDHLDSNFRLLSPSDGPGSARPERNITWVRLRHKGTRDQIVFVNFHWENAAAFRGYFDPRKRPSSPRHIERYKDQMGEVIPLMRDLARFGPILFAGDWNVSFRQDLRLRNPGLPTASFRRINMRSNWDINGLPGVGTHGLHGSVFDAIFLRNKVPGQVRFLNSRVLRGYDSDHLPVLVRARIKNLRRR
jgi:hypothetical protein